MNSIIYPSLDGTIHTLKNKEYKHFNRKVGHESENRLKEETFITVPLMNLLHSMPQPATTSLINLLDQILTKNKRTKKSVEKREKQKQTMAKENKGFWRRKGQPSASKELYTS